MDRRHPFARTLGSLALLAWLAAPSAAADAEAKAFRQASRTRLAEFRSAERAEIQALGAALGDAARAYRKSELTASEALVVAVDALMNRRDAVETAALDASGNLSLDALEIVGAGEGSIDPELELSDFESGTGGTWDRHLAALEKRFDRADARVRRRFEAFRRRMLRAAAKRDEPLVIHAELPAHGDRFTAVAPP